METNDRVCDQNGGRREMEAYDKICDQKRRWKLTQKWRERREMETYDRICDQKRGEKRNGNLW